MKKKTILLTITSITCLAVGIYKLFKFAKNTSQNISNNSFGDDISDFLERNKYEHAHYSSLPSPSDYIISKNNYEEFEDENYAKKEMLDPFNPNKYTLSLEESESLSSSAALRLKEKIKSLYPIADSELDFTVSVDMEEIEK